eukprot:NP_494461.1 Serpentine Receptor, class I [Caenorhabditis elegans]
MSIAFSPSFWLIAYYYSIGFISLIFNVITILLIVFKSYKLDSFKYYLLAYQVSCANYVLQLTILFQPMPLFPLLGGYCQGFLATYLGIWAHYMITINIASAVIEVELLTICFIMKQQSLSLIINKHVIPESLLYTGAGAFIYIPLSVFLTFRQITMSQEDQMAYIATNHPEYHRNFEELQNFAIFHFNSWCYYLVVVTISGGLFCGGAAIFTTADMFRMMKDLQTRVSRSSLKRYRATIQSLIAQLVVSMMLVVPLTTFVALIFNKSEYAQAIAQFCLAICALHSIVNAGVLILSTSQYRNFLARKLPQPKFFKSSSIHVS